MNNKLIKVANKAEYISESLTRFLIPLGVSLLVFHYAEFGRKIFMVLFSFTFFFFIFASFINFFKRKLKSQWVQKPEGGFAIFCVSIVGALVFLHWYMPLVEILFE